MSIGKHVSRCDDRAGRWNTQSDHDHRWREEGEGSADPWQFDAIIKAWVSQHNKNMLLDLQLKNSQEWTEY